MALSHATLADALEAQPLFDNKTWRLSPEAWPLTHDEIAELQKIGDACLEFYRAVELLYLRSAQGKSLFRNRRGLAPWVSEYLDRGKPAPLIEHARSKRLRGSTPNVIRPDLLLTDDGFALTEVDSVPGGIGLTAFLNRLYGDHGQDASVLGVGDTMPEQFYNSLACLKPDVPLPFIAILVSDEAATYRPEMEWLAALLRESGRRVHCLHPSEVMPLGRTLCADIDGNPEQIDIVYRFWELFDMANVPVADYILEAWEDSSLVVTPPMRHFQEEKLAFALFHHLQLEDFWRENLSKASLRILQRIVPPSWILDPVDLPPNAVLHAPEVGGKPIWRWEQLGEASQKERNLILKISGFHETAWGARSVLLGSDASRAEWQQGLDEALGASKENLHLVQEYRKPRRLRHPVYHTPPNGGAPEVYEMEGRTRLTPYYFVEGDHVHLSGILATFCPADKKIIHGMRDAAMLPCKRVDSTPR